MDFCLIGIFRPECKHAIKQKSISEKMLDWLQSRGQIGVLKLSHNNKQGVIWMIDSSRAMFVTRVLSLGRSVRTKNSKNDQKNFQNWSNQKSQKTKVVYFQKFFLRGASLRPLRSKIRKWHRRYSTQDQDERALWPIRVKIGPKLT